MKKLDFKEIKILLKLDDGSLSIETFNDFINSVIDTDKPLKLIGNVGARNVLNKYPDNAPATFISVYDSISLFLIYFKYIKNEKLKTIWLICQYIMVILESFRYSNSKNIKNKYSFKLEAAASKKASSFLILKLEIIDNLPGGLNNKYEFYFTLSKVLKISYMGFNIPSLIYSFQVRADKKMLKSLNELLVYLNKPVFKKFNHLSQDNIRHRDFSFKNEVLRSLIIDLESKNDPGFTFQSANVCASPIYYLTDRFVAHTASLTIISSMEKN